MILSVATSDPPAALTFPRARTVATGANVISSDLTSLARAINARLRSGLGDGTFRILWWFMALFRGIRNADASGNLAPSEAEFFEAYQQLDPGGRGDPLWPDNAPGEPEGVNVSAPAGAYLYGNATADFSGEADRLNVMPLALDGDAAPESLADIWELGKRQRGACDPDTGALASPAFDAARSFAGIRYARHSWWGNSYGSWLPSPALTGWECEDPDSTDEFQPPPNYEIKFSSLVDGIEDKVYPGTCMPGPDIAPGTYDDHVAGVAYAPWAYYVFLWSGHVDVLQTAEWIEGPYTGDPRLTRQAGGHVERVFHRFAGDFRGVDHGAAVEQAIG